MKLIQLFTILIIPLAIHSVNCLDLDEIDRSDIPQIIEARGFICETHYITTSDGYVLGNYRIVNPFVPSSPLAGQTLKPVLVQSGFLGSAVDFIINSPRGFANSSILENYKDLDAINFDEDGRNLGFILANLGYDVWLTNPRGNYYSSNHSTLNLEKDSKQFWSFSLDEMATIDLPAMIDYVSSATGQDKVGYIGFSRGSLVMFGLLSDQPQYSDKIEPFIALAPPVYLNNFNTPLKFLAATKFVSTYIRDHPSACFTRALTEVTGICSNILINPLCKMIKLNLLAIDEKTANASRIDIYLSHLPSGSSCWDFVHFAQRMTSDEFTHLDLGPDYNLKRYGTSTPPEYNLKNVKNTNIAIIHSVGDDTANPIDVQRLIDHLTVTPIERITIGDGKFSHLDFLFDNNVGRLINKPIAKLLDKFRSTENT